MSSSYSRESPKAGEPINEEELRYMYGLNVKVSNFVSVKLLDKGNYALWKKQMLWLLDSQILRGFVDAKVDPPEMKRLDIMAQYKILVQGWILRSLNEDMHRNVSCCNNNPRDLWEELERLYTEEDSTNDNDLKKKVHDVLFPEQVEVTTTVTEAPPPPDNSIRNDKLIKAAVDGRWLEAKLILKNNKDAATEALTKNSDTMLHIAVAEGHNNFLESLLDFIDDENKIKVPNSYGWTALYVATMGNNKRAAQLLVKKCKTLLFCVNSLDSIPLETAYGFKKLDTFLYLWEAVNDEQGKPEAVNRAVDYIRTDIDFRILEDAISTQQYDLASRLVNTFPQVAMQDDRLLMAMARTFPSDLGFGAALICPSLNNFHQRIVKRTFSLFNAPGVLYAWAHDVLWATRSFKEAIVLILLVPAAVLYPLYQFIRFLILVILYPFFMVYFLLWTVLAIAVMPIKHIEKKRNKYQEAKEFVNMICNHIDKLGPFGINHPCYRKPFLEAVRHVAYEVVDEILYRSLNLIECESEEEGHSFIELAIINHSEKIYNLIYYLNGRKDNHRELKDSSGNNILHLAGRLTPERIRSRTTGETLQLQRDLQWFQEVEKLMLPGDLVKKNANKKTPHMVFTREHADLVKEGEQWMKTTSEACSITAALIVTIVFEQLLLYLVETIQKRVSLCLKKKLPSLSLKYAMQSRYLQLLAHC